MIKLLWSGVLILLLSGCGSNATPTRPNDFSKLTSITISAVSSKIASGTSAKFTVTGSYSSQFSRDVTDQAVWSSASPAVADFKYTAAPNINRVTAVAPGIAVVTATVAGVSATYELTVSNSTIQSMTLSPATVSAPIGLKTQFTASGIFSDATTQDLTFDSEWKTNPGTFATVSNDPASKALATAAAIGDEAITATFGAITAPPVTLTVTAATLQSITVTPANSSIEGLSKTVTFAAKGNYSDGTTADITTATWSSSATSIATINSSSGVATSVAVGTTEISATLSGIIGKTNLTVTVPVLSANGLKISPTSPVMSVGGTLQLSVTATFRDSTSQDVTSSCAWTSSSQINASVSGSGVVTGGYVSYPVITASYGGQSVSVTVTVQ